MTTRDRAPRPVIYPESDGKPMAESDIHRDEMARLIYTLQDAFAGRADLYVSGNMLLYYEEGNPRASVAPDVFVVVGVAKHRRRIYKLWEERVPPLFVIEVTSPTTRREDLAKKRALYARLGVQVYVLYDPLAEYLRPSLQGYRLDGGEYRTIEPERDGSLIIEELNLRLRLVDGRLDLFDLQSGQRLLDRYDRAQAADQRAQAADQRAQAADQRAEAEEAARRAAEARIAELEALLRERGAQ